MRDVKSLLDEAKSQIDRAWSLKGYDPNRLELARVAVERAIAVNKKESPLYFEGDGI